MKKQQSQPSLRTQYPAQSSKDFVLDCTVVTVNKLPNYNGLYDRHLVGFFERAQHRKHLYLNGVIDKEGRIVPQQSQTSMRNYQRYSQRLQDALSYNQQSLTNDKENQNNTHSNERTDQSGTKKDHSYFSPQQLQPKQPRVNYDSSNIVVLKSQRRLGGRQIHISKRANSQLKSENRSSANTSQTKPLAVSDKPQTFLQNQIYFSQQTHDLVKKRQSSGNSTFHIKKINNSKRNIQNSIFNQRNALTRATSAKALEPMSKVDFENFLNQFRQKIQISQPQTEQQNVKDSQTTFITQEQLQDPPQIQLQQSHQKDQLQFQQDHQQFNEESKIIQRDTYATCNIHL